MKRFMNKKVAAIGLAAGLALGGAGAAFAFWTTGGTGTGSATTGTPTSNLTITGSGPTGLVPNGVAQNLTLTVTNPNSYSVDLAGDTVAIVPSSIKCGGTSVPDTWFTLGSNLVTTTSTVAASGGPTALADPSGVTLQMNDKPVDQDVCQGAAVTFDLTVTSETGH